MDPTHDGSPDQDTFQSTILWPMTLVSSRVLMDCTSLARESGYTHGLACAGALLWIPDPRLGFSFISFHPFIPARDSNSRTSRKKRIRVVALCLFFVFLLLTHSRCAHMTDGGLII